MAFAPFESFAAPGLARAGKPLSGMTPQEEESLVASLGRKALTGIGFVGNVLDTPGGIARDILAGKNPLPNIFNPETRTTGRELLQNVGLVGPNQEGFDAGDVGGLAAEIAMDPLTYLTLGGSAASKIGKALKQSGNLTKPMSRVAKITTPAKDIINTLGPDALARLQTRAGKVGLDVAKHADEPLGGLARIGIPFTDIGTTIGHGPLAQKIAGGLDTLGEGIRSLAPVRTVASLFKPSYRGAQTRTGQKAMEAVSLATDPREVLIKEHTGRLEDLARAAGITDANRGRIRQIYEDPSLISSPAEQALVDAIKGPKDALFAEKVGNHVPIGWLDDAAEHFPRSMSIAPDMEKAISARENISASAVSAAHGSQVARLEALKGITGNTEQIRKMVMDPRTERMMEGANLYNKPSTIKAIGKVLAKNYPDVFNSRPIFSSKLAAINARAAAKKTNLQAALAAATLPSDQMKITRQLAALDKKIAALPTPAESHAAAFADVLKDIFPEIRKAGLFANDPLFDLERHSLQGARAVENTKGVVGVLSHPGILSDPGTVRHVADSAKLHEVVNALKINGGDATGGAYQTIANRLGLNGADQKVIDKLKNWRMDSKLAKDLTRDWGTFNVPEGVQKVLGAQDSLMNLTKGWWTGVRPGFHGRNFSTGQLHNWILKMFSGGDVAQVHGMLRGGVIKGAKDIPELAQELTARGQPLTDAAATDIFRQKVRATGTAGKFQGEVNALAGHATNEGMLRAKTYSDLKSEFPGGLGGDNPVSWGDIGRKAAFMEKGVPWRQRLNPVGFAGVGGREKPTFGLAAAGHDLGYVVETLNRAAPLLTMMKQGVHSGEAAKYINSAHVNYSQKAFTPFEREVMQRLFPFYKFSSRIAPFTLKHMIENPGGRMAQYTRALSSGIDKDAMVPEQVSQAGAVRVPEGTPIIGPQPGVQRFIPGIATMHGDPMEFAGNFIPGAGGLQAAGLELMSRMNPLLKGGVEMATGRSLFNRSALGTRPLEDLDPTIGRILANVTHQKDAVRYPGDRTLEGVLGNTPLASVLNEIRSATDTRKGLPEKLARSLLGVRVVDMSEGARDALLRDLMNKQLSDLPGARGFAETYIPKDILAKMPPAQQQQALGNRAELSQLDRRARARAKERLKTQAAGSL